LSAVNSEYFGIKIIDVIIQKEYVIKNLIEWDKLFLNKEVIILQRMLDGSKFFIGYQNKSYNKVWIMDYPSMFPTSNVIWKTSINIDIDRDRLKYGYAQHEKYDIHDFIIYMSPIVYLRSKFILKNFLKVNDVPDCKEKDHTVCVLFTNSDRFDEFAKRCNLLCFKCGDLKKDSEKLFKRLIKFYDKVIDVKK
jgi:hypothetical protein